MTMNSDLRLLLTTFFACATLPGCQDDAQPSPSGNDTEAPTTNDPSNVTLDPTFDPSESTTGDPDTDSASGPGTETTDPSMDTMDTEAETDTDDPAGPCPVTIDAPSFDFLGATMAPRFFFGATTETGDMLPDELVFDTALSLGTSTIDFGQAPWNDPDTCPSCFFYFEDINREDTATRVLFPLAGTLTFNRTLRPSRAVFQAEGAGIIFGEIDNTGVFVEDADCIAVTDGTWGTVQPEGWTCAPHRYGDGTSCDCGCGIADPDCDDLQLESCDVCNLHGSCSISAGSTCDPTLIEAENNAICDASDAWTCDMDLYAAGDGICHCGCGAWDPDCETFEAESCDACNEAGSCGEEESACLGVIDATRSWICAAVPGWTCPAAFYDDGDCDCGCGIVDVDCAGPESSECDFCSAVGSCDQQFLGCSNSTINADNNAACD